MLHVVAHKLWSHRLQSWVHSIVGGNCHKHNFCRNKRVFCHDTHCVLSRQNYFHRDKRVATKHVCCNNVSFIATTETLQIFLSRQSREVFYRKHTSVVTKRRVCCDKRVFVVTKMILVAAHANDTNPALKQMAPQSAWLCEAGRSGHMCLLRQNLSRDKHTFVTSKDWLVPFCREKSKLVTTKKFSVVATKLARQKCCCETEQ